MCISFPFFSPQKKQDPSIGQVYKTCHVTTLGVGHVLWTNGFTLLPGFCDVLLT